MPIILIGMTCSSYVIYFTVSFLKHFIQKNGLSHKNFEAAHIQIFHVLSILTHSCYPNFPFFLTNTGLRVSSINIWVLYLPTRGFDCCIPRVEWPEKVLLLYTHKYHATYSPKEYTVNVISNFCQFRKPCNNTERTYCFRYFQTS